MRSRSRSGSSSTSGSTPHRVLRALLVAATAGAFVPAPHARASPAANAPRATHEHASVTATPLPLGELDLVETRSTQVLADGVTLTRITRGDVTATPGEIPTTTRGPWRISVLTVNPRRTRGHLEVTHGTDLARTETTSALVRASGAMAGVNASFFTFSGMYPGVPVGLNVVDGRLLSAPAAKAAEVDLLVDARTNELRIGRLRWSGRVRNPQSERRATLTALNRPPVVPSACADLPDPTWCTEPGQLVRFTPEFGPSTPEGPGVEVVLDGHGCVVSTSRVRGSSLAPGQTSLQATGDRVLPLLDLATGCLTQTLTLRDEDGHKVPLRAGMFGVNGRYRLLDEGQVVVPDRQDGFFGRNPRTIAGTTAEGHIVLATIDGRRGTSVGTTMAETAAVAQALGMRDALNLDGGGSTALAARGTLVNQPSGSAERAVGDALVLLPGPRRALPEERNTPQAVPSR